MMSYLMLQQEKCDTREPAPIISRTLTRSPVSRQKLSRDHHTLQQSVDTWHVSWKHGPEEGHKGIDSRDIQMKIILWWVGIQSSRRSTNSYFLCSLEMTFEDFCGGKLWDIDTIWHTEDPNFTLCFQHTVLAWIPCGFLILTTPFEVTSWLSSKVITWASYMSHTRQSIVPSALGSPSPRSTWPSYCWAWRWWACAWLRSCTWTSGTGWRPSPWTRSTRARQSWSAPTCSPSCCSWWPWGKWALDWLWMGLTWMTMWLNV